MGSYRLLLIAAPLLLALPARAQDPAQGDPIVNLPAPTRPPSSDPRRQGPELDVFRDLPGTAQPATPPPLVVTPTITPNPAPVQARPTPTPSTATPQQNRPARQAPSTPEPRRPEPSQPEPAEPAPVASTSAAPETPVEQAAPAPSENAVASAPTAEQSAEPERDANHWPWIAAAILLAAGLAAFLLTRKRKAAREAVDAAPVAAPNIPVAKPPVRPPASPAPKPQPEPVAPAPAAIDTDRPWLDMQLEIAQARFSLVGVTISYSLILHNRGERPAQDVFVRGVLGNAGPQQQAVLDAFFTGQIGMPIHSAVAIAPSETQRLSGELRLSPEEIAPVQMGERNLLIPIAAFDAAYRWGMEEAADPHGHGRTARAFIVGQDQEPPADRLAPLRVDQGFRQYRRPAARAAAELTPT